MAQRLNDARYQMTSKESSPLEVKRRHFFSFRRFIPNKQRKSSATQIAGDGGDSNLYHTIPRAVRDSDDKIQTSRSVTKSHVFATLFRRSTPTRGSAKRRSIRSLTQTRPLSSVLDLFATSTANSDEVLVVLNNSVELQFPQCGYSDTAPLSLVEPVDAVVEADARLPEEDRQDAMGPTLLFSVSQEETLCPEPLLPTPLIIVSAPTPPQRYLLLQTDESTYEPENSKSLELPLDHSGGILQKSILETLQHVARQLAEDPAWTQANVYRLAIPVVVFLYTLAMGVILPRKKDVVFDKMVAKERDPVFYAFLLALLGLLAVLAFLRLIIWMTSRLVHSFCILDLEVLKKGVCIDSEGKQFGEADLIIGNLLG